VDDGTLLKSSPVALILVSHSAAIADGLATLVAEVAGTEVPILAVGGGPNGSSGTDGGRVLDALRSGTCGAGAVVLMDLGSSVLSVRAGVAELSEEERGRLEVVDAPLVEGAIAAGVAASTGATLAEVAAAAADARGAAKL
jgi:phosphoenolpyruvate---glycerone phosphotransferase subunit DhaM